MDKATGVAERDPARFSVDAAEIERRKRWTSSTRTQVRGQYLIEVDELELHAMIMWLLVIYIALLMCCRFIR